MIKNTKKKIIDEAITLLSLYKLTTKKGVGYLIVISRVFS